MTQDAAQPATDWTKVATETSCLCLGLALLAWGIAPAAIERMVTGHSPELITMGLGSASLLAGLIFVGLYTLIRRSVRWATWTAFYLAALMVGTWFVFRLFTEVRFLSLFQLVLATLVTVATWYALRGRASSPTPPPAGR